MNNKQKLIRLLHGMLLTPVRVGKPVVLISAGKMTRTGPVQTIKRSSPATVVFETGNSVYCVVPTLPPSAWQNPAASVA